MESKKNKIEALKANGYQLEFENVFNLTFENYKKIALYAGLFLFVFSILVGILVTVGVIAFFGVNGFTEMMKPENLKAENISENTNLLILIISTLSVCLMSPLSAGLIKMAYCAQRDEEFHVSTIFEYYKSPYFKEIFIATFLISIFTSAITSSIAFTGLQYVGIFISMLVSFITMLVLPLIIFSNLKAIEAITTSIIIISKQPLILIGLYIVSSIASLIGFFGCCIGLFFTLPFLYSLYYALYDQIVGFEENTVIE